MLVIESKAAKAGEQVQVGIWLDERTVYGLQFDIVYDPAALEFVSWDSALAATTNPETGRFNFAVARDGTQQPLPEYIGSLVFNVSGPSTLSIVDVVAGDSTAQAVSLSTQDGAITIEENNVNLRIEFQEFQSGVPIPDSADGIRVFESDGADPATANLVVLGDIATLVGTFTVSSNRGQRWYFGAYFNEGGIGPAGNVTVFDTNVPPTEAPGAPTVTVV